MQQAKAVDVVWGKLEIQKCHMEKAFISVGTGRKTHIGYLDHDYSQGAWPRVSLQQRKTVRGRDFFFYSSCKIFKELWPFIYWPVCHPTMCERHQQQIVRSICNVCYEGCLHKWEGGQVFYVLKIVFKTKQIKRIMKIPVCNALDLLSIMYT